MAGILQSLSRQLIETSDFVKTAAANNIYIIRYNRYTGTVPTVMKISCEVGVKSDM